MKKILFIAFAVVGFSKLSIAQEATASMTPAPTQAESNKATKAKMQAKAQPVEPAKSSVVNNMKTTDANMANYKKAGATSKQAAAISASMKELDQKKAAMQNNTQLTPDQRSQGLAAIEAERKAILVKNMGESNYKKYTLLPASNAKTKSAKAKATN